MRKYAFNEYENQENIFISTIKFLTKRDVNGFNSIVLAYGATGSGKTFSMKKNKKNKEKWH